MISGAGIRLAFSDDEREMILGDEPLCFDGANAPDCRLHDGPTRDLNLMVQGGRGVMRSVQPGVAWSEAFAMRGVFTTTVGRLKAAVESYEVPALTLLWTESPAGGDWTFEQDEPSSVTQAWWLGFTPDGVATS